jgi:hypothetical protein
MKPDRTVRQSVFERWARHQGVTRPFHILARLQPEEREHIAEVLAIHLRDRDDVWVEAVDQAFYDLDLDRGRPPASMKGKLRPEAEACLIIGMDGKGVQARSHGATRTINPFAANHTWEEVLRSTIREFKVRCRGKTAEDMESAIFEYVANKALKRLSQADKKGMEALLRREPGLAKKLKDLGFGPSATRLVIAGVSKMTLRQGFNAYVQAVRIAAAANRRLGTRLVMSSVSASLKTALRGLNVLLWAWLAVDILSWFFGPSRRRLLPVIAQIRMADLIAQT